MQLYCWRGEAPNFGDELNRLLWPRLLPGFFDDDAAVLFLGIGSVLDVRHAAAAVKLVVGAGYGGYQPPPSLDASWVVHWVRGPRTARRLGLPAEYGLGDPAMLLNETAPGGRAIGFMPHFESMADGDWAEAAAVAGVSLIDPRGDPSAIIAAIGRCRVLLAEAMHGAIVADAMRVPWVALRPLVPAHRAKWQDWAASLDLDLRFQTLAATSLAEWLRASPAAALHRGRRLLAFAAPALRGVARRWFTDRAARALAAAAAATPQLSADAALERCRTRMLERLATLRHDPLHPVAIGRLPAALHVTGCSAYHG